MQHFGNIQLIAAVCAFGLLGCAASKTDLPVVKSIDLQKYLGTWHEIMRLPNSFESGLTCVSATYSLKENGDIKVVNSGHKIDEPATIKTATGTAWIPNRDEPTKLKVRFFWPFYGNYWILALDDDYKYVMIGEPKRQYLWILARDKSLPARTIDALRAQAKAQGFDVAKLEQIAQDCS
ncbi:MAG: lipocalin family protein [Bacteroidota bacterium]|nr:lipocalin family protein [Bacteroidota bacterium]MDP4233950.1 lipocalin family protein [Bacteroidota bacterium]MDP4242799.1 lipocalin family protein [Bacteroidota bacterium]MDP4288513.1 lipocalin family protein [Bacteroidota bacterium]